MHESQSVCCAGYHFINCILMNLAKSFCCGSHANKQYLSSLMYHTVHIYMYAGGLIRSL